MFYKLDQKVSNYLGYFCNKIWSQEPSKIAQSGRTNLVVNKPYWAIAAVNDKKINFADRGEVSLIIFFKFLIRSVQCDQ